MTTATRSASGRTEDDQLVEAVRAGDDAAFAELYRRYQPRIAAYVRGMVRDSGSAEDVSQEAFMNALRRMRSTIAPIAFRPWIFEIARNASIDLHRRRSRAEEISMDADGGLRPADRLRLVHAAAPEHAVIVKERLDHLQGAFEELSETHHQILVMRELEGLSYKEIGRRTGLTRPAVESALFRARRRLEQEYNEIDTGARCDAMSGAIARLAEGIDSARDRRRLARHLRRCAPCRREAVAMNVRVGAGGSKVAGLLPLPFLWRRRRSGEDLASAPVQAGQAAGSQGYAAWLPAAVGPAAESAGGVWSKAAAVIAAVAVAGGGAAAVVTGTIPTPGFGGDAPSGSTAPAPTRTLGPTLDAPGGIGPAMPAPRSPSSGSPSAPGQGRDDAGIPGSGHGPAAPGAGSAPTLPGVDPDVPSAPAPGIPGASKPDVPAPGVGSPDVGDPASEVEAPRAPRAPAVEAPEAPDSPAPPRTPAAPDAPSVDPPPAPDAPSVDVPDVPVDPPAGP